jgi:hypothetical protein
VAVKESKLKRFIRSVALRWRALLAASVVKWGSTAALLVYLRAHGMRPIWGILIGIAAGVIVLIMAFWNVGDS